MNIAIVDDDPKELTALSTVLKEYAALGRLDIKIHTFHSAEELLETYHPYAYTAIFMDVYMDGMDGISAAREILALDRHAILIFLTSSDEHMPDAFRLHAYDYIEKPAKKERLFQVMDDVLQRETELSATPRLTFSSSRSTISLPYSDIVSVKTAGRNYLEITDVSGNVYQTRMTFARVSRLLNADHRFLLVVRGILINMDFILRIEQEICELLNGNSVSINVRNARDLKTTWQNYKLDRIRSERRERSSQR